MARPANADPEKTRERLLEAAAALFSRRGVEAASLREVARTAGVSLATIHYYFGDKEALYGACLDHAVLRATEELAPMVELLQRLASETRRAVAKGRGTAAERGPVEPLAELVRTGFRLSRRHRPLVQLIMRPVLDHGELEPRWRDAALLPFLEQMSALLAERLGRPATALRLDLQSLVTLVMRYALSTPAELARVVGLPAGAGDDEAVAAVEDHLVDLVTRLALGGAW